MQTLSNNLWLVKFTFKKVRRIKKKIIKKILNFFCFFCEISKSVYPRFLRYFYFHGTIILPCIGKRRLFATGSPSVGNTFEYGYNTATNKGVEKTIIATRI